MTDLRRQVGVTVALQALAAGVLGGPLLVTGKLVGDLLDDFYFFRDTLHSLNVFGEYPWWNPSIWAGFPSYYITLLCWPGRDPLFALLGLGAWLLGRMQIVIESYQAMYVVYFAFLVPLLLSLSALALARQILRRQVAIYLVIVLMAFSPTVLLSISDLGVEVAAYGFLFAAALLNFVRTPDRSRFLLLCLAVMAVALSFTFYALFWNVFFAPAFALLICVGRGASRTIEAFRAIPFTWRAAAVAGVLACALPTFVAHSHGADILSARAEGARYYAYDALRPGTPLEALAISTPGIGFEWTDYADAGASFTPRALSRTGGYSSFGYMGLLTLPLVLLGLVLGRSFWSTRLYVLIGIVMSVVVLAAYSPLFSLILAWPTPLRGVNHYSDVVVRLGLPTLFALAAGLGLESLYKATAVRRWLLMGLFAATATASLVWLITLQEGRATDNYVVGIALAFMLLYAMALARLALARTSAAMTRALMLLLALTFVDTSTMAFTHLRLSTARAANSPIEPGPETIGSVIGREESDFLYLRGLNDEALLNPPAQPVVLTRVRAIQPLAAQDISIANRTYNAVEMRVHAPEAGVLEWQDAYFPFWRAWVNGAETTIQRTPAGMKAVRVPAGEATVVFRFSPTTLRVSLALSYLVMFGTFIAWLRVRA